MDCTKDSIMKGILMTIKSTGKQFIPEDKKVEREQQKVLVVTAVAAQSQKI